MIKVNLTYPNGATYESETATVWDLMAILKTIKQDMPIFVIDRSAQGKVPVRLLGMVDAPDISTGHAFIIEPVVDLD